MFPTIPRRLSSLLASPSCSTTRTGSTAAAVKSLAPLRYHFLSEPIPYPIGLKLQNDIVDVRLRAKARDPIGSRGVGDVILLLEHTPTYTTGRRDNSANPNELHPEEKKVQNVGAGFYITKRGGQVTYHGPGQLVGYPILDLNVMETPTRCYVEYLQGILAEYARDDLNVDGILAPHPDGHVGVFASPTEKVASIGIHLSHRITSHGFAMNITSEPIKWFDLVMACGLSDVHPISINQLLSRSPPPPPPSSSSSPSTSHGSQKREISVKDAAMSLVPKFGEVMGRSMIDLHAASEGGGGGGERGESSELEQIRQLVRDAEVKAKEENERIGGWRTEPDLSKADR